MAAPAFIRNFRFRPRLLDALAGYDKHAFMGDVSAGITVGVVALPLAMAFAIASGLKPEAGIFTAIIAGFLIAALGGSRVQIGGPAGAYIVIVYGIVERYGVANLLLATMFAGSLLMLMGVLRLGNLVRLVPVSIVIGFTNGIAVLIALSQVKEFFGLQIASMPADFFGKLAAIAGAIRTVDLTTTLIGGGSLALMLVWTRMWRDAKHGAAAWLGRVPGTIVALAVATALTWALDLHTETIGARFGGIPRALPALAFPEFNWEQVRLLFAPIITLALLGAIESLLCARVADSMIEDRHDPNQELMAQGIANVVSPLFGGFCATGTIARTVTNVRSGARTPVAGIVHALTLLVIVLAAAPLAAHIPIACLAAILLFVAWNMGEWHEFARLRQFSVNYRAILLTTFVLTVVIDLTVAVEVGLFLACLFFITRISALTRIEPVEEMELTEAGVDPQQVEAYRVSGSLFFGAVSKLDGLLEPGRAVPRVTVLDLSQLLNLDTTGLEALESLHTLITKRGGLLVLAGVGEQPRSLIERAGFADTLGRDNLVPTLHQAWVRAWAVTPAADATRDW